VQIYKLLYHGSLSEHSFRFYFGAKNFSPTVCVRSELEDELDEIKSNKYKCA
jgi:hypothetical protein